MKDILYDPTSESISIIKKDYNYIYNKWYF